MLKRDLAPFYYYDHYREMLLFIRQHYDHVLRAREVQFIEQFMALPRDVAALFVRICNRKGCYFRLDRIRYEELEDLDALLTQLFREGFVARAGIEDAPNLLTTLTREELVGFLDIVGASESSTWKRSWPKQRLLSIAREQLARIQHARPSALTAYAEDFIVQQYQETVSFILFLYFGRLEENLGRFAMRDLGLLRTNSFEAGYTARFETAEDAWLTFQLAQLAQQLKQPASADHSESEAQAAWLINQPQPLTELGTTLYDKCVFRLGARLESEDRLAQAATLYQSSEHATATEKAIRLWHRLDESRARALITSLFETPTSDDAYLFAIDFQARKYGGELLPADARYAPSQLGLEATKGSKRTSLLTDMLRAAGVSRLDEAFRHEPEAALARHWQKPGRLVVHAENRIWRSLFVLTFWPNLYESEASHFSSDFQHHPAGLSDGSFYQAQRDQIERVLAMDREQLKSHVLRHLSRCYGRPNSFTGWAPTMAEQLCKMVELAPLEGLRTVLRDMARQYDSCKSGYPDLMIIDADGLRFVEVKAEGDQLRRRQMMQLLKLREAGFQVSVQRVEWVVDPDQPYVVVDVETTGGNAEYGRLTEIGAVIVQRDDIVARWQTLINPGRRIPANITALTGITNEMVANAPPFEAIADDLRTFLGDSIFVAHNVRFDYGFIRQSYRRMEQSIRMPQLCTCAMMKKLKPGLDSYSLKNLTAHFGIPLTQHHRALSDAEAAAGLLKLINKARLAGSDRFNLP
ncbi:exonuclease domain-containing protein [Allohahella marinimesophila]|uniref:DNA-directed DNA polymerase n=1 Tax=Allohahella marinimesophila TaxID=1054972 RepID=A0ABP7PKW3_9GAMM